MRRFLRKLSILFSRNRFREDLDEEMDFHRAQAERELIACGVSPEAARYAAIRRFGNATRLHETTHQTVGFRFEQVWQDLRYTLRQLMRAPGFTATVVLTFALGVGATSAIFALVYNTLMRGLPYPDADRIVHIEDVRLQGQSTAGLMGVPRLFDVQARSKSFESVGFFFFENATLIDGSHAPVALRRAGANADFWKVFRVRPLLGRTFDARDDQPNTSTVAVLSYKGWQRLFDGNPNVIGRQVTIERESATVIGVMPQSFSVPNGIDMWRPAQFNPADWKFRNEGTRFINVYGILKPGITSATAQSDLARIGEQLRHEHADTDGMWQFSTRSMRDDLYGELRPALIVLQIAAGLLLLVACINVANLLLTRARAREREVALRRALGASEGRIRLQFFSESVSLALLGGSAGLGLTFLLIRTAAAKLPGRLGAPGTLVMNWPVIVLAFGIALAAAIFFGFVPALRSGRGALNLSLRKGDTRVGSAREGWMRSAFISAQVAVSLVLLVGASLLAESLWNLLKSPLGFEPDHLLTFEIALPWSDDQSVTRNFFQAAQRRIESLPGVTAVGQIDALPSVDWHLRSNFDADWLPRVPNHPAINAEDRNVGGEYFEAMRMQLLAGHVFNDHDQQPGSHSILVNQQLARLYFAGGDPVGRHLITGNNSFEIIGVVADVRGTAGSISRAPGPEVYWPADSNGDSTQRAFVVRSAMPPGQLIKAIQEQVYQVDPRQAIANVATMDELLGKSVAQPRVNMALIASFAAIALLLACVGIYGVVAWSVSRRVQEIGVRMAMGATRGEIALLFLRRAAASTAIGLGIGTVASLLLTRLLRSQLYGVSPAALSVYAISISVLLVPVLIATLRPSLRAAAINPVEALRAE